MNNSKSFCSYVKSNQRSKDKIGPLKNDIWDIIMKDEQMCTVLNYYFLSVFTKGVENVPISHSQKAYGDKQKSVVNFVIQCRVVCRNMRKSVENLKNNGGHWGNMAVENYSKWRSIRYLNQAVFH